MDAFFLGSGLGTGNQTITVNRTNNATVMYAAAATVTAAANTGVPTGAIVLLQGDQALAVQSVSDNSVGIDSVRYAAAYSGLNAPPSAGTGSTLLNSIDIGNYGSALVRETTAGQGARNVGFTAASDDVAAVHLAIRELVVRTETPIVGQFRLSEVNRIPWSEDLTRTGTALWSTNNATITSDAIVSPDGLTTADLLLEDSTAGAQHKASYFIDKYRKNTTYTASAYIKAYAGTAARRVRLDLWSTVLGSAPFITADPVGGTITSTSGAPTSTGIENVGNGWYRIHLTKEYTFGNTVDNSYYATPISLISGTTTDIYTGNGNSGAYIWGVQYQEGPLTAYDATFGTPRKITEILVQHAISAGAGSFLLSGNNATLSKTELARISAVVGAFTLAGNNATLAHNSAITAETGAFSFTGNPATLAKAAAPKILLADNGTFTLTGGAPSLSVGHHLDATTGAFSLTGNGAGLADTDRLAADTGTFALSGQQATLRHNYRLTAETGTFTTTGQPATLRHNPRIEANTGSFALTGGQPALLIGHYLSGGRGEFTETGQPATFRRTWTLGANKGTFVLTGIAPVLTEIGAYEIDPIVGSFALTGQSAQLAQSQTLPVAAGTFVLSGNTADARHNVRINGNTGGFSLTGNAADTRHNQRIEAATGSYSLTGNPAALTEVNAFEINAVVGTFAVTGQAAVLAKASSLLAGVGVFSLTGNPATFSTLAAFELTADRGQFLFTGNPATLAKQAAAELAAGTGAFAFTGNDVALKAARAIPLQTGAFALTGNSISIAKTDKLLGVAGSFALTGNPISLTKSEAVTRRRNVLIF